MAGDDPRVSCVSPRPTNPVPPVLVPVHAKLDVGCPNSSKLSENACIGPNQKFPSLIFLPVMLKIGMFESGRPSIALFVSVLPKSCQKTLCPAYVPKPAASATPLTKES